MIVFREQNAGPTVYLHPYRLARALLLGGCVYLRPLRPSAVKQMTPDTARLLDCLPRLEHPNDAIAGRLLAGVGPRHATEPGTAELAITNEVMACNARTRRAPLKLP